MDGVVIHSSYDAGYQEFTAASGRASRSGTCTGAFATAGERYPPWAASRPPAPGHAATMGGLTVNLLTR